MKNKLITTILSGLIVLSLSGCEKANYNDSTIQETQQNNRFQKMGEYYYIDSQKFEVVIDSKTKNLYLYNNSGIGYSNVLTLTPLYDENGQITKGK